MVFSGTSPAFAANDVTPVIVVHGMGAIPLYENPKSEKPKEVSVISAGSLLTKNRKSVSAILKAMRGKDVDPNEFIERLKDLLSGMTVLACDENGDSKNDVGIIADWSDNLVNHQDYLESRDSAEPSITRQICDKIGAQNVYAFNYDYRLDAVENSEKLDAYIENVKQQTGKSKVTLIGGSEGTVVISAYVDAHKDDDELEKVIYLYGALDGVSISGLFKKDFVMDKTALCEYVIALLNSLNMDFNFSTVIKILNSKSMQGRIENLCTEFNKILGDETLCNKFYNDLLKDTVGSFPAFWEFIPYDDFDECVSQMSSIGFLDVNSGLYKKITAYHEIQGRLAQNISHLKEKGVEIGIIAGYGYPAIGITSQWKNQSDILIDTKFASVGATVALHGETLENAAGDYVSPDKIIDASTCAFKDNTWFIKGVQHMDFKYGSEINKWLADVVTTTEPMNIESIKTVTGQGQFIRVGTKQEIIAFDEEK